MVGRVALSTSLLSFLHLLHLYHSLYIYVCVFVYVSSCVFTQDFECKIIGAWLLILGHIEFSF